MLLRYLEFIILRLDILMLNIFGQYFIRYFASRGEVAVLVCTRSSNELFNTFHPWRISG